MSAKCTTKTGRKRDLTFRERLFCSHFLSDGNFVAKEAALLAGYSAKYAALIGHQLLKKAHIKRQLEQHMHKVEKKLEVELKHKLRLLWKTAKRCYGLSNEEVERIKNGEQIKPVFNFDPEALIKAIAEMNKMQGHYAQIKAPDYGDEQDIEKVDETIKKHEREF